MRIATLRAPGAPVTSASPMVIITASSLLAANASMEGAYSNQSNFTSTPASLNHPFSTPISKAVQPGQSLNATRSGGFAGGGAGAAGGGAGGGGGRLLFVATVENQQERDRCKALVHGRRIGAPCCGEISPQRGPSNLCA